MGVSSARRWHHIVLVVGIFAVSLGTLQGTSASTVPAPKDEHDSSRCARPIAVAERFGTDVAAWESSGEIRFGDRLVPVSRPLEVLAGPPRGVAWYLWFHSWSWMTEVAREFGPSTAVDLAWEWHVANPDVGGGASRHAQRVTGWSEGAVTQRMTTVTCLWTLTRDERLRDVMTALVSASLDESRYYGRPRVAPHNRGAMANFALMAAGEEFGEPAWVDAARERLSTDFPEVFAACGMDREQSASYFRHNHRLWTRAHAVLSASEDDSLGHLVSERLAAASAALRALTLPSGMLPPIGDGSPVVGISGPTDDDVQWWCEERGWAAGRDSWTTPDTHYTLRFGPAMSAHGHDDHGSVTWWVGVGGGMDVLVDRGNPAKDRDPGRREWARSKAAHNTFAPGGLDYRTSSTATRTLADDSVGFAIADRSLHWGVTRHRAVDISLDSANLVVTDSGESSQPRTWVQSWHLHPQWSVVSVTDVVATARHTNGSLLTISCTGLSRESASPVRLRLHSVPQFGLRGAEIAAHTVTCESRGSTVSMRTWLQVEAQGTSPLNN